MPKKYKTTSLYNIRIGNNKLSKIKEIAIKENLTVTQLIEKLIDVAIYLHEKFGYLAGIINKDKPKSDPEIW